ncbi:MAG: LysR family transcriptional regulator [Sphingomonadaceae bacterium]|nr:LysR family transcriptional regulator [Sphingomonadaceae bacterium]
MLSLRKLGQLVALAEEKNFTRAAERLGMTQPSLSRSIAELEQACGLRLFDRGRLGITLTAAGADLVADARQILGQVAAIEQNLLLQSRGEAGRVAIGLGPLAASYLLAPLLAECLARWPTLKITASIDTTNALIEKVLDGRLDFCVCAANQLSAHPALTVTRIGALRLGYFVRAGHPLAQIETPLRWTDLAPFPRAAGTAQPSVEPSLRGVFGPLGTTVECDDYEVLRQAMSRTDMIWLASDAVLESELAEGRAHEILPNGGNGLNDAELALVRPAGRSRSMAMLHVHDTAAAIMASRSR